MSEPLRDVVIVGAGFAGMYAIYRFRQQGLSLLAVEAGTDVGGTWYWNRYPGARCDVPSIEYSFGFSEELEQTWEWPEVFSAQPDILRYANHVADRFGLRRDIRFETRITAVEYHEHANEWHLASEDGTTFRARWVIMATGCLSVPNKPQLPGADDFGGRVLHTGFWPKEPVDLSAQRVGIIGTGSSGVQAIPELAQQCEHLTVFQRTPVYTVPANRKSMRPENLQIFREHYRDLRALQQTSDNGIANFHPRKLTSVGGREGSILALEPDTRRQLLKDNGVGVLLSFRDVYEDLEANEVANDLFREAIHDLVDDPITAERLAPKTYGLGCKRQVIDRDYYATFNRDDVVLVDLAESPLERITTTGVKTSDGDYPLDVLVYATGFDAMTGALLRAGIRGRDGVTLNDKWTDGPLAFLGLGMRGFPNLFTVTGPGSPSVLCNMLVAIEQHVDWIGECIEYCREHKLRTIEPLAESETEWAAHVNEVAQGTMFTAPTCNSWYLGANIAGKPRMFMPYVGGY
ncbi:MAG: NAD(P)/FAD-dependent oxidoreductase, partial [Gammaproteobacteria bacterium]|nr:NAD(P)/FAD-dependent oxidoreductase [Gammaproteobacteria bacterium]